MGKKWKYGLPPLLSKGSHFELWTFWFPALTPPPHLLDFGGGCDDGYDGGEDDGGGKCGSVGGVGGIDGICGNGNGVGDDTIGRRKYG